ncbi:hypothetical protein NG798_25125 [Ancylothrix sp. C2]|uniref:hypothetical protein n=1 Tax=Ancylothrix sp. D3o TaxID=2953691 RepID=UPI0021BB50AB|nr:hypothetical protein [Ancylothrix sp. D3o]MCT7953085.1 hypothetical protein [Ancylothrix sp. D3o]
MPSIPFEIVIKERIELIQKIANILLPLNIPYVVGGSVASSLWGENRSPRDLDLMINWEAQTAQTLIDAMSIDATSGQFCIISKSAVTEAIAKSKTASEISLLTLTYWPPKSMVDIAVLVSCYAAKPDKQHYLCF